MDMNAPDMKQRMQQLQDVIVALVTEGRSGNGLVKVTVNGRFDPLSIVIDPSLMTPGGAPVLQALMTEALTDVKTKMEIALQAKMYEMTGGTGMGMGMG